MNDSSPLDAQQSALQKQTLPALARSTAIDLWKALPDLVLFDLVFKALAFVSLTPLFATLYARFIATSGNEAVGNFDLIPFLATPVGAALGLGILTLAVAIGSADIAGLLYIAYGAASGRRVPYIQAITFVFRRLGRLLLVSFISLAILALAALPFVLGALFVAWKLLSEHDINFYIDARPAEFWLALRWGLVLTILATAAAIAVAVPLLFVLPEVLFGQKVRSAFHRSYHLARGQRIRLLILLAGWFVTFYLLSLAIHASIYTAGYFLVSAAGISTTLLLTVLGGLAAISLMASYGLALAATASGCFLLARLYQQVTNHPSKSLNHLPTIGRWPDWSRTRKTPLALVLLGVVLAALVGRQVLYSVRWDDHVLVIAHRGASIAEKENTLAAVQRAVEDGATHIEIDVQRTSDGQILVAHDADMMRLARSPLVINRSTFDELRAITFDGHQLPTLDEVIDVCKGKAILLVELKSYSGPSDKLVNETVAVLQRREMLSGAYVMSLKLNEVLAVQRLEPSLRVGFLTSATLGDLSRLDVDFLAVSRSQATDALVAASHAQDRQVYVWTINQRADMIRMIDRGVDGIITDAPDLLAEVLAERRSLTTPERILLRFKSLYVP